MTTPTASKLQARISAFNGRHNRTYMPKPDTHGRMVQTTIRRNNPISGVGYEMEVIICGTWDEGEADTWDCPGTPAGWEDVHVWYYKPGKGWAEISDEMSAPELKYAESELGEQDDYDGPDPDDYYDSRFDRDY
jgi:hypothetical protein